MNKHDLLLALGIEAQTFDIWLERRWIIPAQTLEFSAADTARARLVLDLTQEFGVNDEGVDLILHLIDQLHGMRGMLARLREELDSQPPP